jgi:hypothetical protein
MVGFLCDYWQQAMMTTTWPKARQTAQDVAEIRWYSVLFFFFSINIRDPPYEPFD